MIRGMTISIIIIIIIIILKNIYVPWVKKICRDTVTSIRS